MIPDVARALTPLEAAVHRAEDALWAANRSDDVLATLEPAGRLLSAQGRLIRVMRGLLETEDEPALTMRLHGRLRALHETR